MANVSPYGLFCFLCCLLEVVSQAKAWPEVMCNNKSGNYTANSIYNTNLNTILTTLSSNTQINNGFYNFSYGQNSDKVNAIGLCRGDVKPDGCRSCLNNLRGNLTQNCPNQKEAISYYDKCMLRYSNRSIYGVMETVPTFYLWNMKNVTDVNEFNQVLGNLMRNLKAKAASHNDTGLKYATDNATASNFETLYGAVQCTPDLSQQDCYQCLDKAISEIPSCCDGKIGARVLKPSCNIRYETYLFYEPNVDVSSPSAPPPLSTNGTSLQGKNSNASRTVIAIAVQLVTVGLVLSFI